MSLNTSHASGGVLIYSGERILIYHDGVEAYFKMSCGMPHFQGTKKGRIYLTTHRVIFNSKDPKDQMGSFAMPFYCMRQVELEQPIFGANYIKGQVRPEDNGNWTGDGTFKLVFNSGGAIEFGQAMLQAGRMATRHMPNSPPAYSAPPAGPYYQAPPPTYSAPTGPQYNFIPHQVFPYPPPTSSVYMTSAPPPYPGVDGVVNPAYPPPSMQQGAYPPGAYPPPQQGAYPPPPQGAYPPPEGTNTPPQGAYPPPQGAYPPPPQANGTMGMNGHDAKAIEAGQAAYYNPANPHNVYMPQPYPEQPPAYNPNYAPPPPYSDQDKKNQ